MSKVLLDTDIFSEILKGKDDTVKKHAARYLAEEGKYTISATTIMEIVRGFHRIRAVDRVEQFVSLLSELDVVPLDIPSAILSGQIDAELQRNGRLIGVADVQISACAIRHGYPLSTGNTDHFEYVQAAGFPLVLQNWRVSSD
jgi:predicted nucleic acid-binding protein